MKGFLLLLIAMCVYLAPFASQMVRATPPAIGCEPADSERCDVPAIAWSARYASGLVEPRDYAVAMKVDNQQNVYVTGQSENAMTGYDITTVKYDSAGSLQWVVRYNGLTYGDDIPTEMLIDSSGNIYVIGFSRRPNSSADFVTLKYDAAGDLQWAATYNGPDNLDDYAGSIDVDEQGNVYISGRSIGSDSYEDFVIVKYDREGAEQWVSRYNGLGNYNDSPAGIVVDKLENVVVTGRSWATETRSDIVTLLYDRRGNLQWIRRVEGASDGGVEPAAIVLGKDGNVVVVGSGRRSSSTSDIVAVKYDASGVEQWRSWYDSPVSSFARAKSVVVDSLGNIYVAAEASGSEIGTIFLTVKFDSMGNTQWSATYDNPSNASDNVVGLAVDAGENVYVTGYTEDSCGSWGYGTIKYSSEGAEEWVAILSGLEPTSDIPTDIATDVNGNVYVTGWRDIMSMRARYATVKYDPHGTQLWLATYQGPKLSRDRAVTAVLDHLNNLYVAARSQSNDQPGENAILKYNSKGEIEWVARTEYPEIQRLTASVLDVDNSGNTYMIGAFPGSGGQSDFGTAKVNSEGVWQWTATYDGPAHGIDHASALIVDTLGNVYVTGSSQGIGTGPDVVTVKYDSFGAEQWVARYDGPASLEDGSVAIAIDHYGSVYVTGYSRGATGNCDYLTVKYSHSGSEDWVARYQGKGNANATPVALALDNQGNVVVTGTIRLPATNDDFLTVKYGPSGDEQWSVTFESEDPTSSEDRAVALAVDPGGRITVAGTSASYATKKDFSIVMYDSSGARLWEARYDGPGSGEDDLTGLAVDRTGNVFVVGASRSSTTYLDYTTIMYSRDGVKEWTSMIDGELHQEDRAVSVVCDDRGTAYVTGWISLYNSEEITTIKYGNNLDYPVQMYRQNWNLVSLSKNASDVSRSSIFPSSSTALFEYRGSYASRETLRAGLGYWLKFSSAECLTLEGDPFSSDTIAVVEGWNLIGSITQPVDVANITSIPPAIVTSTLYGFNGTYFSTNTIEPGKGYWIHASQAGQLILSATPPPVPELMASRIRIVSSNLTPPPPPGEVSGENTGAIPREFCLYQNFPNPFNPMTEIRFDLPEATDVRLTIVNILGQEVTELAEGYHAAGSHRVIWNAGECPSGVYFYQLRAGTFVSMKKLLLVR